MTTETAQGAIAFNRPPAAKSAASAPHAETALPDGLRRRAALLGIAVGLILTALAAAGALLLTLAAFGYSLGELL